MHVQMTFFMTLYDTYIYSLSELPECQVPLARRTDVIDQMLAMALHPAYADCKTAIESVETIINLTQSPDTHPYIIRREVLEKVLEICKLKQIDSQTQRVTGEDAMIVNALKYVNYSFSPSLHLFSISCSFYFGTH